MTVMMKAVIYEEFGPAEVLKLVDIPKPVPGDDEVLIRVHATTVSKEEPEFRQSPGFNGLRKPKNPILGEYFAGVVEQVGKNVTRFIAGEKVYGNTAMKFGAYAQYTVLEQNYPFVPMPDGLTFEEAAAIPNGALTSLPFLKIKGKIKAGMKVLVNGASGSVGTSGVQLAKTFGAEVTGVCSGGNLELVKSLGADNVIDYTETDFTSLNAQYDIIFDAVGKSSFSKCKTVLKPGGIYLTTIPGLSMLNLAFLNQGKRVGFMATGLRKPDQKIETLLEVNDLITNHGYEAVIDRTYPLEEIVEAHKYVETGRKRGDVVIRIS